MNGTNDRISRQEVICKNNVIAKFTGKKKTLAQVFSYEFCEIFKNTFFTEYLWMTVSGMIFWGTFNAAILENN